MKQKISLWLGLAFLVLPEILWSSASNVIYELIQNGNNVQSYRNTFLTQSDNINYLIVVLAVQLAGALILTHIASRTKKGAVKWLLLVGLLAIVLLLLFLFYFSFSFGRDGIN